MSPGLDRPFESRPTFAANGPPAPDATGPASAPVPPPTIRPPASRTTIETKARASVCREVSLAKKYFAIPKWCALHSPVRARPGSTSWK